MSLWLEDHAEGAEEIDESFFDRLKRRLSTEGRRSEASELLDALEHFIPPVRAGLLSAQASMARGSSDGSVVAKGPGCILHLQNDLLQVEVHCEKRQNEKPKKRK